MGTVPGPPRPRQPPPGGPARHAPAAFLPPPHPCRAAPPPSPSPPPPPGDIHRYDELCTKYASMLNAQPALVAHERRLREKITILCLMVRPWGVECGMRGRGLLP